MRSKQGRIQDFKLRGGGGAFKKIAPGGGGREIFFGISCEQSRFYAQKSYFFHLRRETRTFFGVFLVKNRDFTPTNHIFSNFFWGVRQVRTPLDPPLLLILVHSEYLFVVRLSQSNVTVYWTRQNTPLSFWIDARCPSVINMILLYLITRRHYKL